MDNIKDEQFKEHIQKIQKKYLSAQRDFVLESLSGALEQIEKVFPRLFNFIFEFIQNAEDSKATKLRIDIFDNTIRILNDGQPFTKDDVEALCKVGRSSKGQGDYIGYLGVGFKSVFLLCDSPSVVSNGYRFKFDKTNWEHELGDKAPWQIIPIWDDELEPPPSGWNTAFNIPVKPELMENVRLTIRQEEFNNRIILFLKYIKTFELDDHAASYERRITKEGLDSKAQYESYLVSDSITDRANQKVTSNKWVVFREQVPVTEKVRTDPVTVHWKHENIKMREVSVAFRLDENNDLTPEERGTLHMGVFSFLPLKDVESPLSFIIQADMLTLPGRSELQRDARWNKWILGKVYELIISKCIPAFLSDPVWRYSFTTVLYPRGGGHELVSQQVAEPLRRYLTEQQLYISADSEIIKLADAVYVHPDWRNLFGASEVSLIYPNKKLLDPKTKYPSELNRYITRIESIQDVVYAAYQYVSKLPNDKRPAWLKKMWEQLSKIKQEDYVYLLRYMELFPDDKGNLYKPYQIFKRPKRFVDLLDEDLPPMLHQDFSELIPDSLVPELTGENAGSLLNKKKLDKIKEEWPTLSKEEKVKKVRYLREQFSKHAVQPDELGFLTLLSKSGEWLPPTKLVISREYQTEMDLEQLVKDGLLDTYREFVSQEFLLKNERPEDWQEFFSSLGMVTKKSKEIGKIVERIGVLSSLAYEKSEGREPHELGESKTSGYDVESKEADGTIRKIEVKGSSDMEANFFLTSNEYKKLMDIGKEYYIYVVTDALRRPTVNVIHGQDIVRIQHSVLVGFSQWKPLVEAHWIYQAEAKGD